MHAAFVFSGALLTGKNDSEGQFQDTNTMYTQIWRERQKSVHMSVGELMQDCALFKSIQQAIICLRVCQVVFLGVLPFSPTY